MNENGDIEINSLLKKVREEVALRKISQYLSMPFNEAEECNSEYIYKDGEESNREVNIDLMMEKLRTEIAEREKSDESGGPNTDSEKSASNFKRSIGARSLRFKEIADYISKHKSKIYSPGELSVYHDREFVQNAYRVLLSRNPDPAGMEFYLTKLRQGTPKSLILAWIRYCEEGRKNHVAVRGLYVRYVIGKMIRMPMVGRLLELAISILRMTRTLEHIRLSENALNVRIDEMYHKIDLISGDKADISKVEEIRINLQKKANAVSLYKLQEQIERKADTFLVNEMEDRLSGKADIKTIELMQRDLDRKAKYDDICDLNNKIENKADKKGIVEVQLELPKIIKKIEDLKNNLQTECKGLRLNLEELQRIFPDSVLVEKLKNLVEESNIFSDTAYAEFQEMFRGDKKSVKNRQKIYVKYIKEVVSEPEKIGVFDLGCGRGEWLEILKDSNISARGVDNNSNMIQQCLEKGFDVEEEDIIKYILEQEDNSVKAITGFQVIEHLSNNALIVLLEESFRILEPGGIVIFETPNPENIVVGSCKFYIDPTHKRPIPPQTLLFHVRQSGFVDAVILRLNPDNYFYDQGDNLKCDQKIIECFTGAQDYSVIAYKPKKKFNQ